MYQYGREQWQVLPTRIVDDAQAALPRNRCAAIDWCTNIGLQASPNLHTSLPIRSPADPNSPAVNFRL